MPQPVAVRNQTIAVSSGTRYIPLNGGDWDNSADIMGQVMSSPGTLSNVHLTIVTAPGGTAQWTITLMKNEVATAITFTITGSAVTGADTTNSVAFVAGDVLCWRAVNTVGTPASSLFNDWYYEIEPTTPGTTQLGGQIATMNNTAKVGSPANCNGLFTVAGGEEYQAFFYVPTGGAFVAFYGYQVGAGTNATGFTVMLNKNGVDQDGTGGTTDTRVTWDFQSAKSVSGGTYNLNVAAGDVVYAKYTVVGTPNTKRVSVSFSFRATNAREYVMSTTGMNGLLANGGTDQWTAVMTGAGAAQPTIATSIVQLPVYPTRPVFITKFYFRLTSAPNSGQNRPLFVQKNGSDTTMTITIANTDSTGNDTAQGHRVNLSSGDTIGVRMDSSGAAAFSRFTYSLVFEGIAGGKSIGTGSFGGGGGLTFYPGGANSLVLNPGVHIGSSS